MSLPFTPREARAPGRLRDEAPGAFSRFQMEAPREMMAQMSKRHDEGRTTHTTVKMYTHTLKTYLTPERGWVKGVAEDRNVSDDQVWVETAE